MYDLTKKTKWEIKFACVLNKRVFEIVEVNPVNDLLKSLFKLKEGNTYSDEQIEEIIDIYKRAYNDGFQNGDSQRLNEIKRALKIFNN